MPRLRPKLPALPLDESPEAEALKPGLYLKLFHGRDDPTEDMQDWGFAGPVIGPLEYAHTTYMCDIKLGFVDEADRKRYFPDSFPALRVHEDMVVYRDAYYGDWSVYYKDK